MTDLWSFCVREARVIAVTLCSLMMSCVSLFFFLDESDEGFIAGAEPVAELAYAKSVVKRKRANKFSWATIDEESPLYLNDTIKTGPDSSAYLKMKQGSTLELGENSLFVLNDIDNLSLSYLRGTVIIRDRSGDKKISVLENGQRKITVLPIRWSQPLPGEQFLIPKGDSLPIDFEWSLNSSATLSKDVPLRIEISKFSNFREKEVTDVPARSVKLSQKFKSGSYYYRFVHGLTGEALSETRSLEVLSFEALSLAPERTSQKVQTFTGSAAVSIAWAPRSMKGKLAVENFLELSRDSSFREILLSQGINAETGLAQINALPIGNYYVRLRSDYRSFKVFSKVSPIQVEKATQLRITLLSPSDQSKQELKAEVNFNWALESEIKGDLRYELELLDSKNKKAFQKSLFNSQAFLWKNPSLGTYRWKVSAYLGDSKVGESQANSLTLYRPVPFVLKSPENAKEFRFWKPVDLSFEWSGGIAAEESSFSYALEVSTESSFANENQTWKTRKNRIDLKGSKLKAGTYFWRVLALDENNQPVRISKVNSFLYGPYPELEAPELRGLNNNQTLTLIQLEKLPELSWTSVKEAQGYEIQITRSGRSPASPIRRQSLKTRYNLELLPEGEYTVVVMAIDPLRRRGQASNTINFRVAQGAPLDAPRLRKPEIK